MRLGIRTRLRQLGWYPQLTAQRGFAAAVSALSWRAWSIGCDGGQISKTGVAAHPLSKEWSERFEWLHVTVCGGLAFVAARGLYQFMDTTYWTGSGSFTGKVKGYDQN